MHEAIIDLNQVQWSPRKEAVRVFYKEMWDNADTSLVPRLFHPDFTFRGSLGPELVGHEQFIGYVHLVTGALGNYTSDISTTWRSGYVAQTETLVGQPSSPTPSRSACVALP